MKKLESEKLKRSLIQVMLIGAGLTQALFAQASLPAPKQEKLLNGLKVLMWSDTKADKVSVKLRIHAGSAFDPQGKEGLMQMLADNLFPSEASREFFSEDLGGSLEIITNYDYIQINASSGTDADSLLKMLETIASAISNPPIDKETTATLRDARLAKVASLEADPSYVADQAAAKRLFGTFPYGRPQYGDPESIKRIVFTDLIEARSRFLTADNATMAISGNFDKTACFRAVRRYFGGWIKSDKKIASTFRQPNEPQTDALIVTTQVKDQANARYAFRGVSRDEKDFGPSKILAAILQNRLRVRAAMFHEHAITVTNFAYALPGMIMIAISPELNGTGSPEILRKQMENITKCLSDPITENEFQTARNFLRSEWLSVHGSLFWLDADTYRIANPNADRSVFDTVTLADVSAYAEKARKDPIVSVLVTAATQNN